MSRLQSKLWSAQLFYVSSTAMLISYNFTNFLYFLLREVNRFDKWAARITFEVTFDDLEHSNDACHRSCFHCC